MDKELEDYEEDDCLNKTMRNINGGEEIEEALVS